MAQVRKLLNGGNPSEKKYGKFIIGNNEIDYDTFVKRLGGIRSSLDPEAWQYLSSAQRALSEGNNVEIDINSNIPVIRNSENQEITENYYKIPRKKSKLSKDIGATFGSKNHLWREAMYALGQMPMYDPTIDFTTSTKKSEKPNELIKLYGFDNDVIKFNNDGYINDIGNNAIIDRLDKLRIYFGLDKSGKEKYDTSDFGENGINLLHSAIDKSDTPDVDESSTYFSDLINRIKNNTLTDVDISDLKTLGITVSRDENGNTQLKIPENLKSSFGSIEDLIDSGITGIEQLDNGIIKLSGNNELLKGNWINHGSLPWLLGDYSNSIIHDGKIYPYTYLNDENSINNEPWYDEYRNTLAQSENYEDMFNSVKELGFNIIGQPNPIDFTTYFPQNQYSPDLSGLQFDTDAVSVLDVTPGYKTNDKKIIAYLDSNRDETTGWFSPKFAVKDIVTGEWSIYNSEDEMVNSLNLMKNRWAKNGNLTMSDYDDKGFAKYATIGNNTILVNKAGGFYLKFGNSNPKYIYRGNIEKMNEFIKNNYASNQDLMKLTEYPEEPKEPEESEEEKSGWRKFWDKFWENVRETQKNNTRMIMYDKNGGTINNNHNLIPKYLYGNTLRNIKNDVHHDNVKDSKSDIVKPHKWNGKDGGLTNAEKLRIGSAIGDAVSVGITFVPGYGNIAGAALGLGSSATQLAADIKQDGFQWSDIGQFGLNAALDAATLIPGAGTAAKASKVVKAFKKIGKPLLTFLASYNVADSVINSAEKIINGEDWTSDDVVRLLRGISSAGILTKKGVTNLGESKLSSKVGKELNISGDKKINVVTSDNKFTLDTSTKKLNDLISSDKSKTSLIKSIKKDIKPVGDVKEEVSDKVAEELLTNAGVNFSHNWWKIGHPNFKKSVRKEQGFWKMPEDVSSIRMGDDSAKSTAYYLFHANKRNNLLNSKEFTNYVNSNAGKKQIIDIFNRGWLDLSGAEKALRRLSYQKAQLFGDLFKNNGYYVTRYNRFIPYPKSYVSNYLNEKYVPKKLLALSPHKYTPQEIYDMKVKARNSRKNNSNIIITPTSNPYNPYKALPAAKTLYLLPPPRNYTLMTLKNGGKIKKYSRGSQMPGSPIKFNKSSFLDLGQLLTVIGGINNVHDWKEKSILANKNVSFRPAKRPLFNYDLTQIDRNLQNAKKPLYDYNTSTSDLMLTKMLDADRYSKISSLEKSAGDQKSAQISKINMINKENEGFNDAAEAEAANARSKYLSGIESAKYLNRAEKNGSIFSAVGRYLAQESADSKKLSDAIAKNDAAKNFELAKNKFMAGVNNLSKQAYSDYLKNSKKTESSLSYEDWLDQTDFLNELIRKHPELIPSIYDFNNNIFSTKSGFMYRPYSYNPNFNAIGYNKKGGRIRSASEQIAIDTNRIAQEALSKMSDALMKLLLQLMR